MAVDVSLPRPEGLARAAVVPARLLLAGLVAVSFGVRFAAALVHTTPLYFPDVYIYGTIARSLAESAEAPVRWNRAIAAPSVSPSMSRIA